MRIICGDIWIYFDAGHRPICITTNSVIKHHTGELVMGRGIALDAAKRFPTLPLFLGRNVQLYGNVPFYAEGLDIISFPTKHHWKDKSDIELIKKSALKIKGMAKLFELKHIYSPWPGCSNGGLTIQEVKPILEQIWDNDKFVIIDKQG